MKFGVFDHLDRAGIALAEQYENRLRLIAAYDAAGFHAYHLAEHHATPLGMAPSPNIFLAAVAQRTTRLRFGPLVYPLALYHPLRLLEEICMLDHLSGGRVEFGIGKGASPHELAIYGVDPATRAPSAYTEALAILLQGLQQDHIDFDGDVFKFRDVPLELRPLQRPRPPMWYGTGRPEGAAWAAQHDLNLVVNLPAQRGRPIVERYRSEFQSAHPGSHRQPLIGMNRFIVIAETDAAAEATAARAYRRWNASFWQLWERRGGRPNLVYYPDSFAQAQQDGYGVAGAPQTVLDTLAAQLIETGSNYLVCRFAFGDITLAEALRTVDLFTRDVMPSLQKIGPATE